MRKENSLNETFLPPDLHIEILLSDQSLVKVREKISYAIDHGCSLGWLIDPKRKSIEVFRPGRSVERFEQGGILEGDPVLPGFRLEVSTMFGWLKWPKTDPNPKDGQ